MGYVVLYTNPRGSTSYGEEFSNLIHHAYPGDDYYDLNSGVDAVIAKGYIDANNLFVTAAAAAASSRAGPSSTPTVSAPPHLSIRSSTGIALPSLRTSVHYQYWFPGLPWENTDNYMQRSLTNLIAR